MSAALAAALLRSPPAIGSRHTYTVKFRSGSVEYTREYDATVTSYVDDRPRITIEGYGHILTEWPGWWQDGTMKEAV